jgi:hypothetical protein
VIALATTTVTVQSATETEPGEGRTLSTIARGHPAQIGSPSGSEDARPGGGRQTATSVLQCDPLPGLTHTCKVTDETTGDTFEVVWVKKRTGLGLDHVKAGLISWAGGGR